jgi:hypothetical protein
MIRYSFLLGSHHDTRWGELRGVEALIGRRGGHVLSRRNRLGGAKANLATPLALVLTSFSPKKVLPSFSPEGLPKNSMRKV